MKFASLLRKIPFRVLVGLGITATGILILGVYFLLRPTKPQAPEKPSDTVAAEVISSSAILAGNTLIDLESGKIIAKQWIEACGDAAPDVRAFEAQQQMGILRGNNGMMVAFGPDGKLKPLPTADGKPLGIAAYNGRFTETVFVRDGDLWNGEIDWQNATVRSPRKITDTGYFRPDVFRYNWLWHEGRLLVPQLMKTLEVELASGNVKEARIDINRLQADMSPLGTFALMPINGRDLGVADLLTGETKKHTIGLPIRKFLWLTGNKAALQVGIDLVAQYDHEQRELLGPQKSDKGVADILAPSPDGNSFLVLTGSSLAILDLAAKKDTELTLKFDNLEWISNEELLCSCSVIDTDQRGLWLVKKTGEMERISNQPVDPGGRGSGPSSMLRIPKGIAFVSRGDLWTFEPTSKELKQLTNSAGLQPQLQALAR